MEKVQAARTFFPPQLSNFPRFGRPERENCAALIHEQDHSGQSQFREPRAFYLIPDWSGNRSDRANEKRQNISNSPLHPSVYSCCVCEVGTVGKISDYQPEGPGFNPWPGRGLNFGRPSFATSSVDSEVLAVGLVFRRFIVGLKRTHTLVDKSRLMPVLWDCHLLQGHT